MLKVPLYTKLLLWGGSEWARLLHSAQVNSAALNHLYKLIPLSAVFSLFAQPFLWCFAKVFTSQLAKRSTLPKEHTKGRFSSGKQSNNETKAVSVFEKRCFLKSDGLQWQHLRLPSTPSKDDKKPKLFVFNGDRLRPLPSPGPPC